MIWIPSSHMSFRDTGGLPRSRRYSGKWTSEFPLKTTTKPNKTYDKSFAGCNMHERLQQSQEHASRTVSNEPTLPVRYIRPWKHNRVDRMPRLPAIHHTISNEAIHIPTLPARILHEYKAKTNEEASRFSALIGNKRHLPAPPPPVFGPPLHTTSPIKV